jgi:redox-sensitive bicupin YhaK (pirin superfamily)
MKKVIEQLRARPTSDGAGVKLLRVFGGPGPERFDPFLMLDEFGSEEASDYIGGFPPHPHRGFETVTYMLQGKMEHQDHMGNVGLLEDGGVQWMTTGKGIIHSEMPKQTEGKMRGFQLWVNLPAANKLKPAHYDDVSGEKIPQHSFAFGAVKVIAGKTHIEGQALQGYFNVPDTEVLYLDIHLAAGQSVNIPVGKGFNTLVYFYDGGGTIGSEAVAKDAVVDGDTPSPAQTLSRLTGEGDLHIKNTEDSEARLLVLAGKPLNEPIVQHGPFVMNTREEIDQAITDYQKGVLTT